jgi:Family of unknown function (DUF6982)
MPEINRIVAHARDGKLIKGTTRDFFPNRPHFHIQPADGSEPVEVRCKTLKAAFFVKEFSGDSKRLDPIGFITGPAETKQGMKIAVRFKDGELLCGYSLTYSADRDGFFMFPADPKSNNVRIYVMTAATAEVKTGAEAEALVKRSIEQRKNRDEAA